MKFQYFTIQPNRWTFSEAKIHDWVVTNLSGETLNACAGETQLDATEATIHRNDLNPAIDADTHLPVQDLDTIYDDERFDTIVFDPPFTPQQATKHYDDYDIDRSTTAIYETLTDLLRPGGQLLTFGYNAAGIPPDYFDTYTQQVLTIWNLLGRQADWFSTILKKRPPKTVPESPYHKTTGQAPVNPTNPLRPETADRVTTKGNKDQPITVSLYRLCLVERKTASG